MIVELNKECVRDVLKQCEVLLVMNDLGEMNPLRLNDLKNELSSYSEATIKYTVKQLEEAGLLDARIVDASGVTVIDFFIFDITYSGHEFLNNIKNDANWNKIKKIAYVVGSSSLNTLSKIAISVLSTQINNLINGGLL